MNTLYININGDDIKSTENMTVVGKPEDAIINKFYFELVRGIVKGVTVPGIGEVKKKNLVTDFEANNAKAFAKITEQWDLVKQALLGKNPDVTFTVELPQEYVEWLYNHKNPVYNKIAESLASRGNIVEINVGNIYRNGLLLLVNVIDTTKEYGQFVVSDALVDDESAIAVAIRKRIGEDVPLVPFVELNNDDKEEKKKEVVNGSDVVFEVKGVQFVMKYVEGGRFLMGAQAEDENDDNYDSDACEDEGPVHEVFLSNYYISEMLVTQALWKAVMDDNPSSNIGDDLPVENVPWNRYKNGCQEFIRQINNITGKNFRLPTEAEWEYAARGGQKSQKFKFAGSNDIDEVACEMSWYQTYPVGEKKPNELDLYDMSGNVWEWCQDWYGRYFNSSQNNPMGPSNGSRRVQRGGRNCRVSTRGCDGPSNGGYHCGFRLCLPE